MAQKPLLLGHHVTATGATCCAGFCFVFLHTAKGNGKPRGASSKTSALLMRHSGADGEDTAAQHGPRHGPRPGLGPQPGPPRRGADTEAADSRPAPTGEGAAPWAGSPRTLPADRGESSPPGAPRAQAAAEPRATRGRQAGGTGDRRGPR